MIPMPTPQVQQAPEKHRDQDRLMQRMITLSSVLSQLGLDFEDFDEEDVKRELDRLPKDSEDYLDFQAKARETESKGDVGAQDDFYEFDLGFEPFNPNEDVEKAVNDTQVAAMLSPLAQPATPAPQGPFPMSMPDPKKVKEPSEVTAMGTASV
jgi:cytochrome c556